MIGHQPSWRNILEEGRAIVVMARSMVLFPGVAVMVTIIGLNLFGDRLRDAPEPKTWER